MLALDRACSRSLRKGGARWSLCRIWHVLSSRIEKSRPASSRTAPARSAHAHYFTCLAASSSAAQYQSTKGTFKGRPYTCISFCNRVGHTNGPIRFRQQLLPSTSGNALILECEVQFLWIYCFLLDDEATGSAENGQGDLFPSTTPAFYLWQRPDPRESGTASAGWRYPLDDQRDQVPKDGQSVSFSSTTIRFYLWQRPDPSIPGQVFLGRRLSPVPERPGFQENTQTDKGTHKRCPYTYGSFRNRVKDAQNGPIRFRQQLLTSTSGNTLILEFLEKLPWSSVFSSMTRRPA